MTMNETRCRGFWVICGSSVVNSAMFKCVCCRKRKGRIGEQMVADLLKDRFKDTPPFTYCVADTLGSLKFRVNRSYMERCGVVFICLASRAVHIVVIHLSSERIDRLERELETNMLRQRL